MIIRPVQLADAPAWESMRRDLWPEQPETHAGEIAQFFRGTLEEPQAVLIATEGPAVIAFAELSLRRDLQDLPGRRVGYVEGLYVIPEFRHRGVARQLLRAARTWARDQRCNAFASDRADRIVVDTRFGRDAE